MSTKPLSPKEILDNLDNIIPPVVIEAVNNLLKENFRGDEISIKQKDIVAEIIKLDGEKTSDEIIKKKWLDFEPIYEKSGWKVSYDKPGYNETYDAIFIFKPNK